MLSDDDFDDDAAAALDTVEAPTNWQDSDAESEDAEPDGSRREPMETEQAAMPPPAPPPRVDEAALAARPLPVGPMARKVEQDRQLAAKLRTELLAIRADLVRETEEQKLHYEHDYVKNPWPLPDDADKYHCYYPEKDFKFGSSYYENLKTEQNKHLAKNRLRMRAEQRVAERANRERSGIRKPPRKVRGRPGVKVKPMRGYRRTVPQAALDVLAHPGGIAGYLAAADNGDVTDLVAPCRDTIQANSYTPPPHHPNQQVTLAQLMNSDSTTITYEDYMNSQGVQSQFALMGGRSRDYGLSSNIEVESINFAFHNIEMLLSRVPRTAGTFPLYPQQRLLIGMLLHGCVDAKLKVCTRDLTRSLDERDVDYLDSYEASLRPNEGPRIRFLRVGTGVGKTLIALAADLGYILNPTLWDNYKRDYVELAEKHATNGRTNTQEGPACSAQTHLLARLVLVTYPPLLKQQFLAAAKQLRQGYLDDFGRTFEIWQGFGPTHNACRDSAGKKLPPTLHTAATRCADTPILWLLPADGDALRKAHFENGATRVAYFARIIDEGTVSADTLARARGNPWRPDPWRVTILNASLEELENLTQNQPNHPARVAYCGPTEDSNTMGFTMTSLRHLANVALSCTPIWMMRAVGVGAKTNMPAGIQIERLYIRFAPLTAQATGSALAKPEGLDDCLHALFRNVQSTNGPAGDDGDGALLDRAARTPLVKKAKKLFENGLTDEEIAELGADPNADVGKAARLLRAQMDAEEELAQLEEAQRARFGGASDEGPPDTTEMRAKRVLIEFLKRLRIMVSGGVDLDADDADGDAAASSSTAGPVCAATRIPIEPAHFAALLPCCMNWQDSRTLPQHGGTASCEHCRGTLDLKRIHSAQAALDAIQQAPALKAARSQEAEAKRNAARIARERRQRVLDATLGPDERNVEGNRDWLLGRIKELRNADLVQPLDYIGALIRLVLHYKPTAKILLAYHLDFATDKSFSSRDQQLDSINNRLADQIANRVPNLPRTNIAGLRATGKMAEVSAYRNTQDQPWLLFCNMIKQCRGAFFGLDLENTDVAIIENITGRLADQDRQQFVGRMMRCKQLPLGYDFVANPESPFPAKLLIDLRAKSIHGGGGEGSETTRTHVNILMGKQGPLEQNPHHSEFHGQDAEVDEEDEDQAEYDEAMLDD